MATQLLQPLDPLSELPLYRQVEKRIEDLIRRDNLQPNQPLPSLTTLKRELGANHVTIRRAIRELALRNVVVTRQGRGTYVAQGAMRKVLWVCGLDLFHGGISAYHTDLLQMVTDALAEAGIAVEPAWLSKDRPEDSQPYANADSAKRYVGYLFEAAGHHPLISYVTEHGHPMVNLSYAPQGRPGFVSYDVIEADRMAMDYLKQLGHRTISLIGFSDHREPWQQQAADDMGVMLEATEPIVFDLSLKRAADLEHMAFVKTSAQIQAGRLGKAIYISDEVFARGATRAMLAHRVPMEGRHIVCRSTRQQMMPLGVPMAYVIFDQQEQARVGVDLLLNQINRVPGAPDRYWCSYKLVQPEDVARTPIAMPQPVSTSAGSH